jgi:hypothetical protein
LKEEQTGRPDGRSAAEPRQQRLARDRLDEKEEERAQEQDDGMRERDHVPEIIPPWTDKTSPPSRSSGTGTTTRHLP